MSSFFAFLHHVAAFALVAALATKLLKIRTVIHWELAGIVVLLLCAALMARGIGMVGA